jgi:cell division protein FtsL
VAIAVAVVVVFVVMLGLVAFQAKIAQDQLRIDKMEGDLDDAEGQLSRLRLQIAQLEAPERIVAEAQKLGLQRPGPDQIRQITPKPEAVGEVLAAGGPALGARPGGSGDLDDWSELKPILNGP